MYLYRLLLRLLPRDVRRSSAEGMEGILLDQRRPGEAGAAAEGLFVGGRWLGDANDAGGFVVQIEAGREASCDRYASDTGL